MRNFLFGLLAFFAFCTSAQAQNWVGRNELGIGTLHRAHAEYLGKHCGGIPVVYSPKVDDDNALAVPQSENFYRSTWVGAGLALDADTLRAVLAHECGHHRLHKGPLHLRSNSQQAQLKLTRQAHMQELEADCYAVRTLKQAGDFKALEAFEIFSAKMAYQPSATHPSAQERIANMRKCAK